MTETERVALHFGADLVGAGFVLEAVYPYTDEHGLVLYWKACFRHPKTGAKGFRSFHQAKPGGTAH